MMKKSIFIGVMVCVLCLAAGPIARADWNPGDPFKMHFPQLPDPLGWDVCLNCQWIADDFQCSETGFITDIHFWISWKNDWETELMPHMLDVSIWNDAGGRPGMMLWNFGGGMMTVRYYGSGDQGWICPSPPSLIVRPDHMNFYQVNLTNLAEPFVQQAGQMYWLVIRINLPTAPWPNGPAVGWKTSTTAFSSPSMWSTDQFVWIPVNQEMPDIWDQAFVITGQPLEPEMDFGDAPDPTYPTWLANDGARHKIDPSGPWLGSASDFPDPEPDGQPDPSALGDDNDGNDDENGVSIPLLIRGQMATISFEVSSGDGGGGFVTGWIDFDGSGSWEPSEQILAAGYPNGVYVYSFFVPATSVIGPTFARFRISRQGTSSTTGAQADGEVEDYMVYIEPEPEPQQDLGDAPDSTNNFSMMMSAYPAVQANFPTVFMDPSGFPPFGPIHAFPTAVAFLGNAVTFENEADIGPDQDGMNNINPPFNQPDLDGADDGILFPLVLPNCMQTQFNFTVTQVAPGPQLFVNVWADWNRDGDWDDTMQCPLGAAPEWAVQNQPLMLPGAGIFMVPTNSFLSWHPVGGPDPNPFWLRITLSEQPWQPSGLPYEGGCGPARGYEFGETEDYLVREYTNEPELDFGDAPDSPTALGYPTLLINNGAHHRIGGPWLGDDNDAPDTEWDGQPDPSAFGDDNNGNDDEDGVMIPILNQGISASIQLEVNDGGSGLGGVVQIWIDWNQDQVWQDPAESIYSGWLADGIYLLGVVPPMNAAVGKTFARFRISTNGGLPPFGPADDGEVEDYAVWIEEGPTAELGDAPDSSNNAGTVMTAYPAGGPLGVPANFPTVFLSPMGGSPGPIHRSPLVGAWLGSAVTLEDEADIGLDQDWLNNLVPPADTPDLDGADDGLVLPVNMPRCKWTTVDYIVNVATAGDYYINIWADWNRDGDWDDLTGSCPTGLIPEWAVRNQLLHLAAGSTTITSLPFVSWHDPDLPEELWVRITLSEQPWQQIWGDGGCGPTGGYLYGETEDYYIVPDTACTECADLNCDGFVDLDDLAELSRQWLSTCP